MTTTTILNYIESITCECGDVIEQGEDNPLGVDVLRSFEEHILEDHSGRD